MGGGFMADNKDMSMLQQKQQQSPLQRLLAAHAPTATPASATQISSQAAAVSADSALTPPSAPSSSHKRKIPDPLSNTTTSRSSPPPLPPHPCSSNISKQHKKKLLKVILKVPNSNSPPSPSPPLPPPLPPLPTPHSSSSSSPFPSPSPSPSPSLSPPPSHPLQNQQLLLQQLQQQKQRQQLASELQQYHHQQQQQRLFKSPQLPKQQQQHHHQIKHPTQDPKKHHQQLPKKLHHFQQLQQQEEQPNANRLNLQQHPDQPNPNRQQHHAQQSNPSRIKPQHLQEEQLNPNRIKHQQQENETNPNRLKQHEQQQEEHASLNQPTRQQQHQEEQHTSLYPKRLKLQHQNRHEQTNQALASPKIQTQQQHKFPLSQQISSQPGKKLPQSPNQGPHGLHQSPKMPPLSTPSPRHNRLPPSIPAPVQSSPSLSAAPTSAVSDEAQKPSKKRKLRSVVDSESTESHVAVSSIKEQHQDSLAQTAARPGLMPSADTPVLKPHLESKVSKDLAAARISPKPQVPQFVPAKKLLKGILDRLQKKDKFGVFAEPVDPKEVPNYYDIIKDPMDFGTMKTRIVSGHYTSLDPFERDIFLICSNAMKYNGKGTVYFRHARAIKDVAERILEDMKKSGLTMEMDEVMLKQKNGGPYAKKSHKKQFGTRPWVERVAVDHASGVSLATGGGLGGKVSIAGMPESSGRIVERHGSSIYSGSPSETRVDNQEDISGYLLRTMGLNDCRRFQAFDENRRSTYRPVSVSAQGSDSLVTTISGESLQFVPTGYQLDFPYARSLARFAADLGPCVWRVAAEKIRRALPPGFPFGPGWVGEREAPGGIFLAPSSKQHLQVQSSVQPTVKLTNEDRPLITGNSPVNQESSTKLDHQSNMQCSVQPMVTLPNSNENMPIITGKFPVNQESLVKLAQSQGAAVYGSNSATVNLNHPASSQQESERSTEDRLSNRENLLKGNEDGVLNRERLSRSNLSGSIPGMASSAAVPVINTGRHQFEGNSLNKGVVYTSMASQMDRVNPLNDTAGAGNYNAAVGMKNAALNQFESRPPTQLNRLNSLNGNLSGEASPNAAVNVKNASHHYENNQLARGPTLSRNVNVPAQHSVSSHMGTREVNLVDSVQPSSSLSYENTHSARGPISPQNLNMPAQHTTASSHVGTWEVNSVDSVQPKQVPLTCPERSLCERYREGSERNEMEMLNCGSRATSSMAAAVAKKGFNVGRSFMLQRMEGNSEDCKAPDRDQPSAGIRNHDQSQSHEKSNATVGPSAVSFPPVSLPTSNGASRVHEDQRMPGWLPAQQPDLALVAGNGGMKMQSHVPRSSVQSQQVQSTQPQDPHLRLGSLQQQGFQDGQVYRYGNQKHVPNVPHFLQQQLSNNPHSSIQHQQMQLQLQSSSKPAAAQYGGSSESWDPKFVRHLQLPGHLVAEIPQSGNPAWQYMAPQMALQQGSNLPFSGAPDLNVSLPPTKSPFDQVNGSELQQPDLALQL